MIYENPPVELPNYRKYAIAVAEDLKYSEDVIDAIQKARTQNEITRILYDARNNER